MKDTIFPFYLKLACVLISIIAIGFLAIVGKDILLPLLFSFLFAILLLKPANFLENKWHLSRAASAGICVLLFLTSASLILYLLGAQISDLSQEWPLLKGQLLDSFHKFQIWLQEAMNINIAKQTEYLNTTTHKVLTTSGTFIEQTVISISSILLMLVFTFIYTFFLLLYRRHLMRFLVAAFTEKHLAVIFEIAEQIKYIVKKYITGLFFQMAIVIGISCLLFWLLGIKYVLLLGLLVGLLNLIPYVGIFTALLISVLVTFATVDGNHAIYVGIAIICIHLVDSNFLMPKIVGSQVKVNPLIVIIGVVIGEKIWGIPGMFLSVPYIAMAKVIFDRVQSLEAWGILLGDEEQKPVKLKLLLNRFKRKVEE
ncbi:MAG: AI-2E family transporter [Ginsengibacter sp.]|jgi:predicted PurR-regulated permease PerM